MSCQFFNCETDCWIIREYRRIDQCVHEELEDLRALLRGSPMNRHNFNDCMADHYCLTGIDATQRPGVQG